MGSAVFADNKGPTEIAQLRPRDVNIIKEGLKGIVTYVPDDRKVTKVPVLYEEECVCMCVCPINRGSCREQPRRFFSCTKGVCVVKFNERSGQWLQIPCLIGWGRGAANINFREFQA
jgi:hypothetical protein